VRQGHETRVVPPVLPQQLDDGARINVVVLVHIPAVFGTTSTRAHHVPNRMRPLVAACAACLSAVCVQPLDTLYLQRQLQTRSERAPLRHPMAGCVAAGGAAFMRTGIYVTLYEYWRARLSGALRVPLAALVGTMASSLPGTYLTVRKKRSQAERNALLVTATVCPLTRRQWTQLYLWTSANRYPKTAFRYLLYELLLSLVDQPRLGGFVAGLVSSVLVNLLFEPLEAVRSYRSLGVRVERSNLYNGVGIGMLSTTLSNTLAHGIVEAVCPRR